MKYILRTLWFVGYIFVYLIMSVCFLITLCIYPFAALFYFIKTGHYEDVPFSCELLPVYIDKKYRELLKYL